MQIEYLNVLIQSIEDKEKKQILNVLNKKGFIVKGFNDLKKINDAFLINYLSKTKPSLKQYLKAIEEVYSVENIDKLKLRDKQYITSVTNKENVQGILAMILNNNQDDNEIIEYVINKFILTENTTDEILNTNLADKINEEVEEKKCSCSKIDSYKKELSALRKEIDDLKEQNRAYRSKNKQIGDELKNSKISNYSKDNEILRLKQKNKQYTDEINQYTDEINQYTDKIVRLNKEKSILQDKYNNKTEEYINLNEKYEQVETAYSQLKNEYEQIKHAYNKKNILIVGLEFEILESLYINITFSKEEILKDGEEIKKLLNNYNQIWIILNEISSYPLKRRLNKLTKSEINIKSFNNPSELNDYIKENELNGTF